MRGGVKSFNTKNGYCHIYPDRLEIIRKDAVGWITLFLTKRGYRRAWVLYLLLSIAMVIATMLSISIGNYFLVLFFLLATLLTLGAAWKNRDLSFAPVIQKKNMDKVVYHRAVEGESRATFVVYFKTSEESSKLLRRIIPLPTRTHQGTSLADTAYWMMRDEGWLA